jgi:hypothetical protein
MFSEKRGAQKNNIIEKMKNFIGAKVKGSSKVGRNLYSFNNLQSDKLNSRDNEISTLTDSLNISVNN